MLGDDVRASGARKQRGSSLRAAHLLCRAPRPFLRGRGAQLLIQAGSASLWVRSNNSGAVRYYRRGEDLVGSRSGRPQPPPSIARRSSISRWSRLDAIREQVIDGGTILRCAPDALIAPLTAELLTADSRTARGSKSREKCRAIDQVGIAECCARLSVAA
jgi:hypothetical protein